MAACTDLRYEGTGLQLGNRLPLDLLLNLLDPFEILEPKHLRL
jgi:hypothetical protein